MMIDVHSDIPVLGQSPQGRHLPGRRFRLTWMLACSPQAADSSRPSARTSVGRPEQNDTRVGFWLSRPYKTPQIATRSIAPVQNPPMLTIGTVVLGVSDFQRALDFWLNALHYVPREEPDEDWAVLVPPEGTGTRLALGLSETLPQEYPRVHLDLYAQDAASEVERLLSLGAEHVEWDRYPDDPDFVVLADPEGNRFCVVDKSHG